MLAMLIVTMQEVYRSDFAESAAVLRMDQRLAEDRARERAAPTVTGSLPDVLLTWIA